MAVKHVKVHQVDEGQPLEIAVGQLQRDAQPLGIAAGADGLPHALAGEDIVNFAHADRRFAGRLQGVQHRIARRHQAEVMPAGSAPEIGGAVAHERPRDDTADAVFAGEQFARLGADLVEFFHRDDGLVGGDLEHAVGRGVDDQRAGAGVLLAIIADDLGAGIGLVAQHLVAGFGRESVQQLLRETVREGGQRLGAEQAGDLPMADGGILAGAGLAQARKAADGLRRRRAAAHAVQVEKPQLGQMVAPEIRVRRNGGQRVGAGVAKLRGVRLGPDAEAVQYDQKDTFCHILSSPWRIRPVKVVYVCPIIPETAAKVKCNSHFGGAPGRRGRKMWVKGARKGLFPPVEMLYNVSKL